MVRRAGSDWRDYPDLSTLVTAQDYKDYSDALDSAVGPGRTRAPLCIVHLTTPLTMGPADVFAQTGWAVTTDTNGMASLSTTTGTYSSITIPETGRYDVLYHTSSASNSPIANYVSPSQDHNEDVATDLRMPSVFNLVMVDAIRWSVPLTEGATLYWGNWALNAGAQIETTLYGIPTHIVVRWAGPN